MIYLNFQVKIYTEEDSYEIHYQQNHQVNYKQKTVRLKSYKLQSNKIQQAALKVLENLRKEGKNKGILISATGERDMFMTGGRNIGFTRILEACAWMFLSV